MSKSLEALKQIEEELYLLLPKVIRDALIQPIKQDLERLETLEKENKELIINKNVAQAVAFDQKREIGELKDQISYLKEDGEEWQSAYEWSQAQNATFKLKNEQLEKENQELKIENEAYIEQGTYVINQLNKLKKAIEILKCFINYVEVEFDTYVTSQCTDEEQDFLKEVLS